MSKNPEEEIEQKLHELEIAMKESSGANVPAALDKSTGLAASKSHISTGQEGQAGDVNTMKADLHLLGGFTLLLIGILILFSHLQVHVGLPANIWGFGAGGGGNGTGGFILILLVGLGFFFYDYKNKIGWLLIVSSLAALVFFLFTSMNLTLAPMSLLGFIFLFLPWVLGGGLLARGIKMHGQMRGSKNSPDK